LRCPARLAISQGGNSETSYTSKNFEVRREYKRVQESGKEYKEVRGEYERSTGEVRGGNKEKTADSRDSEFYGNLMGIM
jgi:hypothetical protein